MVDILLRLASVAVLLLVGHQLWSRAKGGSPRHNAVGIITMGVGVLLVVLVTIRGSEHEGFDGLYLAHLFTGGAFFLCLFLTGILGWRAKKDQRLSAAHQFSAWLTTGFLCGTLALGVASFLLH